MSESQNESGTGPRGNRLTRALEVLTKWETAGRSGTIDELLAKHAELRDLLEPMLQEATLAGDDSGALAERTRARLEVLPRGDLATRYRVEEEVGRGGMGEVFRVLDRPLERELALKRSTLAADGSDPAGHRTLRGVARFLEEAQITGQLDHPGVVPLHELALDEEGRPYFTMKLVRGETLGEVFRKVTSGAEGWTQARALGTLQRVCETMAFAHDRGVMHRDLKPANVMVGRFGEVYVMDWGLARAAGSEDEATEPGVRTDRSATRDEDAGSPLLTADGALVGTPAYMSPEQARGEIERIDRRSDVYAVGAMLYELLAGAAPFVRPGEENRASEVLLRVLRELPRALDELDERPPAPLQAICERAMARDPDARYASMAELAEDLRAYLEDRVVRAYRTGALVELRSWVRRNRMTAASLAAVFLFSLAGAVGASMLVQTVEARDEALADAEAVTDFLRNTLFKADPFQNAPLGVTVRDALDEAAEKVEAGAFAEHPRVEEVLRDLLADTYINLGLRQQALPHAEALVRLRRELFGERSDQYTTALMDIGVIHYYLNDFDEAERIYRDVLALRTEMFGPDSERIALTLHNLSNLVADRGRHAEAEEMALRTMELWGTEPTLESRKARAFSLTFLGKLSRRQDDPEGAEAYLKEALEIRRDVLEPEDPSLSFTLHELGILVWRRDVVEGERLMREGHDILRKRYGDDGHPDLASSCAWLAWLKLEAGQSEGTVALLEESLEIRRRLEANLLGITLELLGRAYEAVGRFADAAEAWEQSRVELLAQNNEARALQAVERLVSLADEWPGADTDRVATWRVWREELAGTDEPEDD